jgi:hypothetical protein
MLPARLRLYQELEAIATDFEGIFDSPTQVEDFVSNGILTRIALVRIEPWRTETTTRFLSFYVEVKVPDEGRVDVGKDGEAYALTPLEVALEEASERILAQLARMDVAKRVSRVSIEPPEKRIKPRAKSLPTVKSAEGSGS